MKKYVKPELFYESFELSQHIAACGIDVNNFNETTCASLDPDFWEGYNYKVFNDSDCAVDVGDIEFYCYTVGTSEAGRLFNS